MLLFLHSATQPGKVGQVHSVRHEPSDIHEFPGRADCRQSAVRRKAHDASVLAKQHRAGHDDESVSTLSAYRGERTDKVVRAGRRDELKL